MTNLDSIFKSRGITLPTKVHLVKVMVFPVVMYGWDYIAYTADTVRGTYLVDLTLHMRNCLECSNV